jgi:hypothetical protein
MGPVSNGGPGSFERIDHLERGLVRGRFPSRRGRLGGGGQSLLEWFLRGSLRHIPEGSVPLVPQALHSHARECKQRCTLRTPRPSHGKSSPREAIWGWSMSRLRGTTYGVRTGADPFVVCVHCARARRLPRDSREASVDGANSGSGRFAPHDRRPLRPHSGRPLLLDEELRDVSVPAAGG